MSRGISSNGRAPASHAGGIGIDTRILHFLFSHIIDDRKTRKPRRILKEMKLEMNVTVFLPDLAQGERD